VSKSEKGEIKPGKKKIRAHRVRSGTRLEMTTSALFGKRTRKKQPAVRESKPAITQTTTS